MTIPLWKKCIAEFIGTAFLTATIKISSDEAFSSAGDYNYAPFAIGFVLCVCIFSYGYISGANFNPSVTTGIMIRQLGTPDFNLVQYGCYYIAQILGGIFGGFMSWLADGEEAASVYPDCRMHTSPGIRRCFFSEFFFTFLLVTVVLHTATDKRNGPNHFFGLAIGMVVMIGAYTVGNISGGCFNFAVWVGAVTLAESVSNPSLGRWWLYLIAPQLGAAIAGVLYRFVFFDDNESDNNETDNVQTKLLDDGSDENL
jgi:aquaporin Z